MSGVLSGWESEFHGLVQSCAEQGKTLAQTLASSGIFEPLYLYYLASQKGQSGSLVLVRDSEVAPTGAVLATSEGLRGNVPYADYFNWIQQRARHCPVLAY